MENSNTSGGLIKAVFTKARASKVWRLFVLNVYIHFMPFQSASQTQYADLLEH